MLKFTLACLQSHHISLQSKLDSTVICDENLRGSRARHGLLPGGRVGCGFVFIAKLPVDQTLVWFLAGVILQRTGKVVVKIEAWTVGGN